MVLLYRTSDPEDINLLFVKDIRNQLGVACVVLYAGKLAMGNGALAKFCIKASPLLVLTNREQAEREATHELVRNAQTGIRFVKIRKQ